MIFFSLKSNLKPALCLFSFEYSSHFLFEATIKIYQNVFYLFEELVCYKTLLTIENEINHAFFLFLTP